MFHGNIASTTFCMKLRELEAKVSCASNDQNDTSYRVLAEVRIRWKDRATVAHTGIPVSRICDDLLDVGCAERLSA